MKTDHFTKTLKFIIILALVTVASGCNLPSMKIGVDSQTRGVLEDAIDELGNWPGEWKTTLNSVVNELGEVGSELAKDIRSEVETLIRSTVQTAQEASFCEMDFIGIRAKQHMQAILHSFFPDADPAVFTPIICTVNPTIIQSDSTNQVEYSGFDFIYFRDSGSFNADLVYGDTGDLIQENFGTVNVVSNYHIVVDIQGYDYSAMIASRHPALVVKWNSDTIEGQSEIPINIVLTPITPAPEIFIYELNHAMVYTILAGGPDRGSSNASMPCPLGSVVTGLWGKKGEYITQIGLICSPLNQDGTTGTRSPMERQGNSGGDKSGGDTWDGMVCSPNSAFAGIVGVYGGYVDRIQGMCKNIIDESDTMYTGWAGEGGFDEVEVICRAGYVVTGINIKWGKYIDGLTLVCTQVSRVAAPPSPPGSSSDFHVAPTSTPNSGSSSGFRVAPTSTP